MSLLKLDLLQFILLKITLMSERNLGLLAAFGATLIYGFNHTIAKIVMPIYIQPYGFVMLRVIGAALIFWILSLFINNDKIQREDWPRIFLCSFLGMFINKLAFFKGLELSTPINSSVLITAVPILFFIFSNISEDLKRVWCAGVLTPRLVKVFCDKFETASLVQQLRQHGIRTIHFFSLQYYLYCTPFSISLLHVHKL